MPTLPPIPTPWRKFTVPVYGGTVIAYRRKSALIAAAAELGYAPEGVETSRGYTMSACDDTFGRLYLIGWFDGRLSTLVHESGHATINIFNDVGIANPADADAEPFCYLLDCIFNHLHKGSQWVQAHDKSSLKPRR